MERLVTTRGYIHVYTRSSGNCSNGNCDDSDDDEKCPPDSILDGDGTCRCEFRHCFQPICRAPAQSVLRKKSNSVPGDCCDVYECVSHDKNCSDVICPEEVETCPEDSYRLPAYKSPEDCCLKPQSCQCLPRECKQRICPEGQHSRIVRPGNGKPGTCCPLYDCITDKDVNLTTARLLDFGKIIDLSLAFPLPLLPPID
ncbi:hypothetical protein Phum_PHUM442980 [Pediculus humanus corporis]|uniref:VWFC domain-containing protein n=1 Tax=Pediculus humanus subsp. corporis TaxID=121224 RepID=E0VU30_PEDHC|nr:uncharacterized protein Phum_PHUM442980 [Pediculus humanus corporis]EEB16886.1 hypothetical protein Phum_PHUM442980 [Pediculus humanus corporis]